MKYFNKYNLDYLNFKDYSYDIDDYSYDIDDYDDSNIFELRTLSKSEFNKLIKTIEETIEKAKKNKQ